MTATVSVREAQRSLRMFLPLTKSWLQFLPPLLFNIAVGIFYAAYFLTGPFLQGRSAAFISPTADFQTYLTGGKFFIHDRWHFPLFVSDFVERSVPQSLAFFDLNPLFALIAKLIYKATGHEVAYQAWWYATSIFMQPVAFTLLIWFIGVRNRLILFCGGALAVLVPSFLTRVGHTALFGSFTYIVAMALYFAAIPPSLEGKRWLRWVRVAWPIWLCIVAAVHLYLLAMAAVYFCAAVIQHLLDCGWSGLRGRLAGNIAYAVCVFALLAFELYVIGDFIPYQGGGGIGLFSMNILSPFVPLSSSLFQDHLITVDATGYQYEGYNYLGAGILVLLTCGLLVDSVTPLRFVRRHAVATAATVLLILFAISNKAYFGPWLVWNVPLPDALDHFLGNWRATGRFFWPVTYLVLALSLSMVAKLPSQKLIALLGIVFALQWADTRKLIHAFWTFEKDGSWYLGHVHVPPGRRIDDEVALRRLIADHVAVHIEPDFGCLYSELAVKYMMDLAWFSSLEERRINTVRQARSPIDLNCNVEAGPLAERREKGYLTFAFYNLNEIPGGLDRSNCAARPGVLVCMTAKDRAFNSIDVEHLFSPAAEAKP